MELNFVTVLAGCGILDNIVCMGLSIGLIVYYGIFLYQMHNNRDYRESMRQLRKFHYAGIIAVIAFCVISGLIAWAGREDVALKDLIFTSRKITVLLIIIAFCLILGFHIAGLVFLMQPTSSKAKLSLGFSIVSCILSALMIKGFIPQKVFTNSLLRV